MWAQFSVSYSIAIVGATITWLLLLITIISISIAKECVSLGPISLTVSGRARERGGGGRDGETSWPLVSRDLAWRKKRRAHSLRSCRHTIPSETHNHYLCCCVWAAAEYVPKKPKTLVRTLVKFVKFTRDNNQTTRVAKGVSSRPQRTARVRASGTQVYRCGGDLSSRIIKGIIIKIQWAVMWLF